MKLSPRVADVVEEWVSILWTPGESTNARMGVRALCTGRLRAEFALAGRPSERPGARTTQRSCCLGQPRLTDVGNGNGRRPRGGRR